MKIARLLRLHVEEIFILERLKISDSFYFNHLIRNDERVFQFMETLFFKAQKESTQILPLSILYIYRKTGIKFANKQLK